MNNRLDILREKEVPHALDARILTAARLSAAGYRSKSGKKKFFYLVSTSLAASFAVAFAIIFTPSAPEYEVKYYALNDTSSIEQEAFALASELNCNTVYALDNTTWENL